MFCPFLELQKRHMITKHSLCWRWCRHSRTKGTVLHNQFNDQMLGVHELPIQLLLQSVFFNNTSLSLSNSCLTKTWAKLKLQTKMRLTSRAATLTSQSVALAAISSSYISLWEFSIHTHNSFFMYVCNNHQISLFYVSMVNKIKSCTICMKFNN